MRKPFLSIVSWVGLHLAVLAWPVVAKDAPEVVSPAQLLEKLTGPAMPGGFVAQVGWGDGRLLVKLAESGKYAIHVLEADAATVAAARVQLVTRNLNGVITVEWWPERYLPYGDDLINALLVETPGAIEPAELVRVTAPLGVIWVKQGEVWSGQAKPWPKEYDQWTHWRHAADGNMVSHDSALKTPTGVRWVAGPAQDTGGRKWYYDHVLVSANGRNFYVYDDGIVARDAFNGRLLWQRDTPAYTFRESGSPIFLKLGVRPSKVRPVAQGDRLYAPVDGQLVAIEATGGKVIQTFGPLSGPREILVAGNRVLMSDTNGIRAFATSGELAWEVKEAPKRMVASEGKLFYLAGHEIACLDLETGQPAWRVAHELAGEAVTCTAAAGVLVLERSSWKDDAPGNGILVFSTRNGALLWEKEYTPGMTHFKEARAFFMENLLWLQTNRQKIIGLDPLTGKEQKQYASRGLHCAAPLATENYFIAPEVEFTDLKTGERSRARMFKSACRLPFVPANGLLYTFPVQCECYPMLRGYMGMGQQPVMRQPESPRLQKGPAYGSTERASTDGREWPMYRHDRFRSNYTTNRLAAGTPRILWAVELARSPGGLLAEDWEDNPFTGGLLTPLVCARQTVLVAAPDTHQVIALEAGSGSVKWRFTAGGRVDTPPSVWAGNCVFGAHDGYVYCVRMSDGQMVWRFRAAPQENRLAAYGQMESVWPVAGGVLVEDGVAYFAAGRHPASDGGVRVCALVVADGKMKWEKTVADTGVTAWYSGMLPGTQVKVGVDYEPVDLLVRDGRRVAMSRWGFDPDNGRLTLSFTNTNYVAFANLPVPRGVWGYGIRQTKQVLPKPPAAFNPQQLFRGTTNDVALVLAGDERVIASQKAELTLGDQKFKLESPPVRDGLLVAYGRLYAATKDGRVICVVRE